MFYISWLHSVVSLFQGRQAWHYVDIPRYLVNLFLKKVRSGQVDVSHYGTVVKSGWGEVRNNTHGLNYHFHYAIYIILGYTEM